MTEAKTPSVDLDAWISQASLPEIEETVYRDGRLIAQIKRLENELDRAPRGAGGGARFSGGPTTRAEVEQQLADLVAATGEGALTFRLRALTDEQRDDLARRFPQPGEDATSEDRDAYERALGVALLAAQAIDPNISEEQGARLRAAIGDAQMTKLVTACGTVNRMVIGDAAFWRRSSGKTPA